jgi:hypothetical protein
MLLYADSGTVSAVYEKRQWQSASCAVAANDSSKHMARISQQLREACLFVIMAIF